MSNSRILCVYPIDGNIAFLRKLSRTLRSTFGPVLTDLKLSNNYGSHQKALNEIKASTENDLICLFCHGRSTGLLGCSYKANHPDDSRNRFVYSEKYGNFLDVNHSNLFINKKIFCLACDSAIWGKRIIDAGAKVFLGFSNVNFDTRLFLEKNVQRQSVERIVKFELRKAVFYALNQAVEKSLTFSQLSYLLKICLDKSSDALIRNYRGEKGYKFYLAAAECLQEIKFGVKIFGDGNVPVFQ